MVIVNNIEDIARENSNIALKEKDLAIELKNMAKIELKKVKARETLASKEFDIAELREMAAGVVGSEKESEIIFYCGVGGYASAWWYVLVRMLGYRNVKIYDGAAEEWTSIAELPMAHFIWE